MLNYFRQYCIAVLLLSFGQTFVLAGEKLIVQLKDFSRTEIKSGGFSIPSDTRLHIYALGGGEQKIPFSGSDMYAYGWIIKADTRETVWQMNRENTKRSKDNRTFDDYISLPGGSYEVYFTAYGYGPFYGTGTDLRKLQDKKIPMRGLLQWLRELFGEDIGKDWKVRSKNWELDLYVDDEAGNVDMFNPPKEFPYTVYKATRIGDNEHVRQRFIINKPVNLRIYSLGEKDFGSEMADYGWIMDTRTHKLIWQMDRENVQHAGGDQKNVKYDDVISFQAGDYVLFYTTDASHSFVNWNAAPPSDPFNYGITLIASKDGDKREIKLTQASKEDQNVIVQLVRIGNNETRNASFTLKAESKIRIYALGEASLSRRQMADYGWIINTATREKVWTMDLDRSDHAGGADKNRMIDEVITLQKGTYTVFYQTDDSHAYNDWNDSPPFDPEHWGITVSGEGDDFKMSNVEKNVTPHQAGVIAQVIGVGDNANLSQQFYLDKTTRVRVYALGEGQNRELYDYGWIENSSNSNVVWEMTYAMTFHAGGGRKNRSVSTTIVLDKGNYILHYVSDDSHSYNHWNVDPPDDPTMWGITLYEEK